MDVAWTEGKVVGFCKDLLRQAALLRARRARR